MVFFPRLNFIPQRLRRGIPAGQFRRHFETLPEVDIATLLGGRRALLLAPHPDDESLGAGGFIAAAAASGLAPVVAMLTDGAASHPGSRDYPPSRLREVRAAELRAATALLGLPEQNLVRLDMPDGAAPRRGPGFDLCLARLAGLARGHDCGLIVGPWAWDGHPDHGAAALMSERLAGQLRLPLLTYPVWGWLRPPDERLREPRTGGFRLDISAQLPRKRQAVAAHRSQYGGLIKDSPAGFTLPDTLLEACLRQFEVFIA